MVWRRARCVLGRCGMSENRGAEQAAPFQWLNQWRSSHRQSLSASTSGDVAHQTSKGVCTAYPTLNELGTAMLATLDALQSAKFSRIAGSASTITVSFAVVRALG